MCHLTLCGPALADVDQTEIPEHVLLNLKRGGKCSLTIKKVDCIVLEIAGGMRLKEQFSKSFEKKMKGKG